MKEISMTDIKGIQIGQAEDEKAGTGCTVILCKEGATAGVDVRGGGPVSYTHLETLLQQNGLYARMFEARQVTIRKEG